MENIENIVEVNEELLPEDDCVVIVTEDKPKSPIGYVIGGGLLVGAGIGLYKAGKWAVKKIKTKFGKSKCDTELPIPDGTEKPIKVVEKSEKTNSKK